MASNCHVPCVQEINILRDRIQTSLAQENSENFQKYICELKSLKKKHPEETQDVENEINIVIQDIASLLLIKLRKNEFDNFSTFMSTLKSLREDSPHFVNQALRAIINGMVYSSGREYIFQEVVKVMESVAFGLLHKYQNAVSYSRGDIDDILQDVWLKEATKFQQLQKLKEIVLQSGTEEITKENVSGLFNPLVADFLSWFAMVIQNRAKDVAKMSGRKKRFEEGLQNLQKQYLLKHEGIKMEGGK